MKKRISKLAAALLAVVLVAISLPFGSAVAAPKASRQSQIEYVPGKLIVELREESDNSFLELFGAASVERLDSHVSLRELKHRRSSRVHTQSLQEQEELSLPLPESQYRILVPEGQENEILSQLLADPRVFYAERVVAWRPLSNPMTEPLYSGVWAGTFFGQWYAKKAQFERAWDRTMGRSSDGKKPVVAVIDTAFQADHPDYVQNVDPRSRNFTSNGLPEHGTGVAGQIGSKWNGLGIAGLTPEVSLVLLGVGRPDGSQFGWIDSATVLEAMNYFVSQFPEGGIVNMSFGGPDARSEALLNVIRAANNILVFASAGNNGSSQVIYPAGFNQETTKVVAVAASDFNDNIVAGTNYGFPDLAAPGNGNLTTAPGSTWGGISVTSAAAGVASGAAGLCWYLYGGNAMQVRSAILRSVDVLPSLANMVKSGGRLNAARAAWGEFNPGPPELDLVLNPASGIHGQAISLSANVSGGSGSVTYNWNFGDGSTGVSNVPVISHIYQNPGMYNVQVSASDGSSQSTSTAPVRVTDKVTIKSAGLNGATVTVVAKTSASDMAPELTAWDTSGNYLGTLKRKSGGAKYKSSVTAPVGSQIIVKSSLGGEATRAVN